MPPKTTLLFLFFLLPLVVLAQQIVPPEVRVARPVEEVAAPEKEKAGQGTPRSTPAVAPVAPPEATKEQPAAPAKPSSVGKKPPPAEASKTQVSAAQESTTTAPASALNAATLLPIGVPSYDVRMPEFDEEFLVSRMRARVLTRIDDVQLDLRNMDLERYLPDGSVDYIVNVERGFYDLTTGRLISSAPTRLRGKSIDLYGQGCVYSKDNEVIKILGNVTSYIYVEGGRLTAPKPKPPAAESPPPAAPAQP